MRYALNKTKYLLAPEYDQLMASVNLDTRDGLLIALALATGARATELLNLRPIDLNDFEQSVFIRGIKHSNDREIPLRPELYAKLKYFSWSHQHPTLFNISYSRLIQIWQWYRPVPKKFHSLRHTFAIQLYQRTHDIRLVQVALGHRSISNTMIYADYAYTQSELRKLIIA